MKLGMEMMMDEEIINPLAEIVRLRHQIEEFKRVLRIERALFLDPHPGLASWQEVKDGNHKRIDELLNR